MISGNGLLLKAAVTVHLCCDVGSSAVIDPEVSIFPFRVFRTLPFHYNRSFLRCCSIVGTLAHGPGMRMDRIGKIAGVFSFYFMLLTSNKKTYQNQHEQPTTFRRQYVFLPGTIEHNQI